MNLLCTLFLCLTMSVSAFTDADGAPPYRGQMKSGAYTAPGAAACPPSMPFGTVLFVPGFGGVVCLDRGGAVTEGKLDVWTWKGRDWALNIWERRQLTVVVLRR